MGKPVSFHHTYRTCSSKDNQKHNYMLAISLFFFHRNVTIIQIQQRYKFDYLLPPIFVILHSSSFLDLLVIVVSQCTFLDLFAATHIYISISPLFCVHSHFFSPS
jgi:hypothetical protein